MAIFRLSSSPLDDPSQHFVECELRMVGSCLEDVILVIPLISHG